MSQRGAPRGRGRGRSNRGPCDVKPTHMTMTRPCASVLGELPAGASLLGGAFDFCDAFFHVRETPEAPLPLCCVRVPGAPECEGRNTVIVARLLGAAGGERLVARYHNRSKMYHAEKVMMTDGALLGALRPKLKAGDHFLGRDLPEQPFVGAQLLLTGTCESKSGKSLCAPPQLAPSPESVAPWVAAFRDAHGVLNTHGGGGTVRRGR